MTDRSPGGPLRRWRASAAFWPLVLVAVLGLAVLVDSAAAPEQLQVANPDRSRVSELRATLAGLPRRPLVLVGMDPDLGTYPEIRPVVRGAFAQLLDLDARLAMVSFTPEGRAAAAAEIDRLVREGTSEEQLADLGYVAGAEAGLVLSVTEIVPPGDSAPLARAIAEAGDGIAAFDLVLVVGGTDFGPRSWVEQVVTRVPDLPIVAVAPTFQHPELSPYLRTGQLAALLATVRDGSAYLQFLAGDLPADRARALPRGTSPLALSTGMLVALAVIGGALYRARWLPDTTSEIDAEETP